LCKGVSPIVPATEQVESSVTAIAKGRLAVRNPLRTRDDTKKRHACERETALDQKMMFRVVPTKNRCRRASLHHVIVFDASLPTHQAIAPLFSLRLPRLRLGMAGGNSGRRRRGDVLAVPGRLPGVHLLLLLLLVLLLLLSSSPSSFVAGLDCSRGSDCSSGLCRNGQCCTRGDETCLTCSATSGACLACAPGFLLRSSFFDGAVCRRADGGPCQTSADCASSVCKGGRCCGALGQAAGCSACGDDAEGRCAVCLSRRYVLEAGRCVGLVPAGEACARDDECAGGAACKGGVCCRDSGAAAPCSACALGTGLCASCVAPGHFLLGSECVPTLATGAVCSAHEQCLGRYCIGGRCCGTAGVPLACTACASSGACLGCAPAASYFLSSAGTCLARRSVGSSCGINDQCVSGACKGGVCCSSQGVPAACSRCSTIAGSCSACQAGFFLSGGTCLALLAPGASCTADSQCAQLACKGGVCCAADGQNEACSSCRAGDGGCAVCWGRGTLGGLACQPRKVTGPCEADTECAHGACKRGACCAGSLALTAGCVACSREAGQCIECAASQLLLLGTCLPRIATGDSCLGSAQCPGGNPCRGHCCASRNTSCTACDAVTGNCHSGGQDDAGSGSGSKADRTRDATIASGVVACLLFVILVALAGYLVRTKLPRQRPRRQGSEPNNDTNSNGSNGSSSNNDAAVDGGDTEPLRAWDSPQRLPRGAPVPPAQQV
jgi:hypothetical protein